MKKFLIHSLIIAGIAACATPDKFVVTKTGDEPDNVTGRFVYNLPRTVLMVKVDYINELYIPGPYRRYTEKYLGMNEFIDQRDSRWIITGAEIKTFNEPDPAQYYSVNQLSGVIKMQNFIQLGKQGLVLNPESAFGTGATGGVEYPEPDLPYFTDISVNEYTYESTDTLYKTIIRDTTFIRIPVVTRQRDAKTVEQKAEEAANFIFRIRNRRFMIESGSGDEEEPVVFDGKALGIAIEELNKLEKDYLSLFLGKIHTRKFSRTYFIVPTGKNENIVLAKFSPELGLLPAGDTNGESLSADIKLTGTTDALRNSLPQSPSEEVPNTYYYRVPDIASVKVLLSDDLLYESRGTVYQAGSIVTIPVESK